LVLATEDSVNVTLPVVLTPSRIASVNWLFLMNLSVPLVAGDTTPPIPATPIAETSQEPMGTVLVTEYGIWGKVSKDTVPKEATLVYATELAVTSMGLPDVILIVCAPVGGLRIPYI